MAKKIVTLKGRVISKSLKPIQGLRVEAWDKDLLIDDLLGSAVSDESGSFVIKLDERYYKEIIFDRRPDIYFKVYRNDELILSSEKDVLWNVKKTGIEINIEVPIQGDIVFRDEITVKGSVSTDARSLPSDIIIRIINQNVLDETVLASATIDIQGRYTATVLIESLEQPAIIAKAIDGNENTLAVSSTAFDIADPLTLDIFIPAENIQRVNEYIEIQQKIKPLIGDKPVTELTPEQLNLIAGKARISITDLEYNYTAQQISLSENISGEILYGLFKKGLPTKLSSLYKTNSLDLRGMIAEAVKDNIITQQDENAISAALEKIQRLTINNVLNEPLVTGGTSFSELIKTSGVSDNVTLNFVKALQMHTGTTDQLWSDLEEGKYGIEPEAVEKLRFSVQAGSLALGHLPMANSIMQLKNTQVISDIKDLVSCMGVMGTGVMGTVLLTTFYYLTY